MSGSVRFPSASFLSTIFSLTNLPCITTPHRRTIFSYPYTMSSSYYQQYHQHHPTATLPVNVPGKTQQPGYGPRHQRAPSAYSQLSASPPERPESISTSSGAGLYSSASSQYGGSDYEYSTNGATSVDVLDYMNDRLANVYDPLPLDRNVAKQAQM